MRWAPVLLLAALGAACGGSSTPGAVLPAPVGEATLQPGDSLRVLVWRNAEMSGAFIVAADGRLAHPLYRRVAIADLPLAQVQRNFEQYLEDLQREPQVLLEPRFQVSLTGEVRLPGRYWVPLGASMGVLLAGAGGTTDQALLDQIRVRRGQSAYRLDLTSPTIAPDVLQLRSGDEVVVPRRGGSPLVVIGVLSSLTSLAASILVLAGL